MILMLLIILSMRNKLASLLNLEGGLKSMKMASHKRVQRVTRQPFASPFQRIMCQAVSSQKDHHFEGREKEIMAT